MATLKFKIDNDSLIDDFFHNTRLMGIIAPVPDYRFCWLINQQLNFNFRINTNFEIQLIKKERKYFFPIYEAPEKGTTVKHYLYKNQHEGEFLLPEFRHLDFLWLITGDEISDMDFSALLNGIKTLPSVQLVAEMQHEKLKNKQNLVF